MHSESRMVYVGVQDGSTEDELSADTMDHPAVLSVMEMGYSKEILTKAVTALRAKKADFTAKNIMQCIIDFEEEEEKVKERKESDEKRKKEYYMEEMTQRLKFKVCQVDDVEIVFMPCGHLCTCVACAEKLKKCPVCRGTKQTTVKIFIP